jgi:hypothetical protein
MGANREPYVYIFSRFAPAHSGSEHDDQDGDQEYTVDAGIDPHYPIAAGYGLDDADHY